MRHAGRSSAAASFVWSAARLLDRHRYTLLFADGSAEPVLEALRGYRNADGGFGHALEPDLRCPGSQPAPTLHALGVLNEAGAAGSELARDARAWIVSIAEHRRRHPIRAARLRGLPARAVVVAAARFLSDVRAGRGHARRRHRRRRMAGPCHRLVLALDRDNRAAERVLAEERLPVPRRRARRTASSRSDRVARRRVDESAIAGADGEGLRALDLSPHPGSRSRDFISEALIEAHLDAVESGQQEDGGWMFDFLAWSPAQTTDWRGVVTIDALRCLHDHGRL